LVEALRVLDDFVLKIVLKELDNFMLKGFTLPNKRVLVVLCSFFVFFVVGIWGLEKNQSPDVQADESLYTVLTINNLYAPHAVTLGFSLMQQIPKDVFMVFYVLVDDEFSRTEDLDLIPKKFSNCKIVVIRMGSLCNDWDDSPVFPKQAYYRLLIPEVLPRYVHRAVYLDVDMVVTSRRVIEIYRQELNSEQVVGAVKDPISVYRDHRFPNETVGFNPQDDSEKFANYFNSGMILFDLDAARRIDLCQRIRDYFQKYGGGAIRPHDQCALNHCLNPNEIKILHPRFNCLIFLTQEIGERLHGQQKWKESCADPAILHYAGRKPFKVPGVYRGDEFWEKAKGTGLYKDPFSMELCASYLPPPDTSEEVAANASIQPTNSPQEDSDPLGGEEMGTTEVAPPKENQLNTRDLVGVSLKSDLEKKINPTTQPPEQEDSPPQDNQELISAPVSSLPASSLPADSKENFHKDEGFDKNALLVIVPVLVGTPALLWAVRRFIVKRKMMIA
jgi:lipopolysaccharide biosynthesis glycosyltransferase